MTIVVWMLWVRSATVCMGARVGCPLGGTAGGTGVLEAVPPGMISWNKPVYSWGGPLGGPLGMQGTAHVRVAPSTST